MHLRVMCFALLYSVGLFFPPDTIRADDHRPFVGKLDFTITQVVPIPIGAQFNGIMTGKATVIGQFSGPVSYDVNLADGSFTGTITKKAKNGDVLNEIFIGQLSPDFSTSVGVFIAVSGTGKFKHPTGGGLFYSEFTSQVTGVNYFFGSISLGK